MKSLVLFPFQLNMVYLTHAQVTSNDTIYILETDEQYTRFPYHKKRIYLHMRAARAFMSELHTLGYSCSLLHGKTIVDAIKPLNPIMFYPTDDDDLLPLLSLTSITWLDDPLFIVSKNEWTQRLTKKPWKMDTIYRQLRKKHGILMDQGNPIGGKFSFDSDNRKPYKKGLSFHEALLFEDTGDLDLKTHILQTYASHPGDLDTFIYPTTRTQALDALNHFIYYRLPTFGAHQDVMIESMPWMSHSLLSTSMNLGLLTPMEVIRAAEKAYHDGLAPIEDVEGFIRQILGWREYVRGVYLLTPNYEQKNILQHKQHLPEFYWTHDTTLNCLSQTISETISNGYNHHIQRLMILSNFANLIHVDPKQLRDWFNIMYVDSFDWIVAPNVIGMGLYADGGMMSTKPYISSGAYIHKMSNYCTSCMYDPKVKTGPNACPFNYLYWGFLERNQDYLKSNPRMSMMYNVLSKMDLDTRDAYKKLTLHFIQHVSAQLTNDKNV